MPSSPSKRNQERAGRSKSQKQAATAAGELYFLGIGINEYQSEDWPNLNNAVRDVQAIATLLQADFGLTEAKTYFLQDDKATRANILKELDDFSQRITPADSLIIYYAGHGHLIIKNTNKRGFWVPTDGKGSGIHSFIRNSAVKEHLADINSLHTLLISDSCFSGSLFVRSQRNGKLTADELRSLPSRWAICSGRHDETVADGPAGNHSPFAESILDVLRSTERAYITANFLYEQVRDQTRSNYEQLPDGGPLAGVGHKRGEFVFLRTPKVDPDAEKVAELEAELKDLDELLAEKQFRKAKRILRGLKDEIAEELESEIIQKQLLEAVEERLGFCESYARYRRYYDALEQGSEKEQTQLRQQLDQITGENKELRKQQKALQAKLSKAKRTEKQNVKLENELQDVRKQLKDTANKLAAQAAAETGMKKNDAPDNMVLVKGGSFMMGDVFEEGRANERPVHEVLLKDFWMSPYPVTFAEYDAYCQATGIDQPSDQGWGREQHPVINVSWLDAVAYCNWLSEKTGKSPVYTIKGEEIIADWQAHGYRLPTEAEWEYAARAGGRKLRFGNGRDQADSEEMNFDASNSSTYSNKGEYRKQTLVVGSLKHPNDLGLHDMSGNVWEWCWDWYGEYPDKRQEQPAGPVSGQGRVIRGGSWHNYALHCRLAFRNLSHPTYRNHNIGFRVVLAPSLAELANAGHAMEQV